MAKFDARSWIKISIINLMTVAILGILMRYKIGFEFPFFNQKYLLHAHSHFAFTGWVSQTLMVCMVALLKQSISEKRMQQYQALLWSNLLVAWGMLISFTIQGYGAVAITFSTLSIVIAAIFAVYYFADLKNARHIQQRGWFKASLVFNIISAAGTFWLAYMMATKNIPSHNYLASVYWFLHFQYNGWFFFACMGLLAQYVFTHSGKIIPQSVFWWFALSCVPAYGLSTLWLNLPDAVYILVLASAVMQMIGWWQLIAFFLKNKLSNLLPLSPITRTLIYFMTAACTTKLLLQLGSVIPELSKLAFGFRPIIIAYLHLILLAVISVFLIFYLYIKQFLPFNRFTHAGIYIFLAGVLLNELTLGLQGVASFSYTLIPYTNETLVYVSLIMLIGVFLFSSLAGGKKKEILQT